MLTDWKNIFVNYLFEKWLKFYILKKTLAQSIKENKP